MEFIFSLGIRTLPGFAILFIIQYLLSKRKSKILGLILPLSLFIFSIALCASYINIGRETFTITTNNKQKYVFNNKEKFEQKKILLQEKGTPITIKHSFTPYKNRTIFTCFVKINIFTIILLLIFLFTQYSNIQNRRMLIKDL